MIQNISHSYTADTHKISNKITIRQLVTGELQTSDIQINNRDVIIHQMLSDEFRQMTSGDSFTGC